MTEINKQALVQIAKKNATAEAAFTVLATRERNRSDMDIRRLKYEMMDEGFKVVSEDLLSTFKELERIGIGRLETVKGQPPRFHWHASLKDVGKTAIQGVPKSAPIPRERPKSVPLPDLNSSTLVVLGPNRYAKFELPKDITREELKFIADNLLQAGR